MAHEYLEPTTICTCKTDNFLINIWNQQLYVLAKQTIHALLKLMVKMNTRNLHYMYLKNRQFSKKNIRNQQPYVLAKQIINALLKLMVKMNTRNWKKGRLNSEKIWKIFSLFFEFLSYCLRVFHVCSVIFTLSYQF